MAVTTHIPDRNAEFKTLDAILDAPLSRLRMTLHQRLAPIANAYKTSTKSDPAAMDAIGQHTFGSEQLSQFITFLDEAVQHSNANLSAFRAEKQKVEQAIATGHVASEPDTRFPATQLLWAAALGYMAGNPSCQQQWDTSRRWIDISDSQIWKAVENSRIVENELLNHAFHLAEDIGKTDTRLRWGQPGSWFYSDRDNGLINLDLIGALTLGLEHARSAAYHEIGHSKLTLDVSPRLREILDVFHAQDEHIRQGGELEPEEYLTRQRLSVEMKLRQRLWNSGEDNCVNRYAINKHSAQDHSYSLNVVNVLITGTGTIALNMREQAGQPTGLDEKSATHHGEGSVAEDDMDEAAKEAQKRFFNLVHMVNMSVFQHNGLFENTREGWESVGVNVDWITEDPNYANATGQSPEEALQHIRSLCHKLETAQPTRRDRIFGKSRHDEAIQRHFDHRMEVQEEIWQRYCQQHANVLMEQIAHKAEQQLEQSQSQQGDGQEQNDPQQDGQEHQQSGNKQQGGQQQDGGNNSSQQEQGNEDVPVKGHGKQKDRAADRPSGHGPEKQQEAGQGNNEQGEGQEQPTAPAENANAEDNSPSTAENSDQQQQGENGQQPAQHGKQGRTLEELLQKRQQQQDAAREQKAAERGEPVMPDPGREDSIWGQGGTSYTLDSLPVGNWEDYATALVEYAGPINQLARILEKLCEAKYDLQKQFSRQHSLLPEDSDLGRFDMDSELNLIIKKSSGEKLEETDFARFRVDAEVPKPALDDMVIAIDLSGSMGNGQIPNRRVDMAIQSACILMEAGKRVGMNVYVCGWGDTSGPRWLATPSMRQQQIGANIAGAKDGAKWGTHLAPALTATQRLNQHSGIIELLSQVQGDGGTMVGDTHLMVVSDGDLADGRTSALVIERLLRSCDNLSVDIGVINAHDNTEMHSMTRNIGHAVQRRLGISHASEPQDVQDMIIQTLRRRVQACVEAPAIPLALKKQKFDQALRNLTRPGAIPSPAELQR